MKKGLIMEGGGMRGMFTCGVIDVFMENEIEFNGAAGISAGTVFGINYKSRQIGRALRYNKQYGKDPRYCSFKNLIKTGDLYGAEFCYHTLPDVLDPFDRETFRKNPMEFYIGATDVDTGKSVFHRCSDGEALDIEWMRASASMPIVSKPVKIGKLRLLDGGIACPVPYRFMGRRGYDTNVVILTQPKNFRKKKSTMQPFINLMLRKYPAIARGMEIRHITYNDQMNELDKMELFGKVLIIRPPEPLGIGRTENDPAELDRIYQMGRSEAYRRMKDVKTFLGME